MKTVRTVVAVGLSLLACLAPASLAGADAPPANSNPFDINGGIITRAEGAGVAHQSFDVGCPMPGTAQTQPTWFAQDGAANPACRSGAMTITVTGATKYYARNSSGQYAPATYEQAVIQNSQLRVWGKWARVGFDTYELVATLIYTPGNDLGPGAPPEPKPEQPCTGAQSFCLTSYNGQKRFAVNAQVVQTGAQIVSGAGWSDKWGFVVGSITDYSSNPEIQAIALAHQHPQTADPQLVIYTEDGGVSNSTVTNAASPTKYFIEGSTGQYAPATKAETVVYGATLRVIGSYQYVDGWRLIAHTVFRPAPTSPLAASVIFNGQLTYGFDNVNGSQHFGGNSNAGDGKMNPSAMTADLTFVRSQDSSFMTGGTYSVTGTWTAARTDNSDAVGGRISGVWYPPGVSNPGRLDATVTVEMANGHWCGFTGAGSINGGSAAPKSDGSPAQALNLPLQLKLIQTSSC